MEEVFNLRKVEGYLVKWLPVSNELKRRTRFIQYEIDSLGLKLEDLSLKNSFINININYKNKINIWKNIQIKEKISNLFTKY